MAEKEYEGEWTIPVSANPIEFKNIVTPTFAPFSNKNISFRFEALYQEVINNQNVYYNLYLFKLKLVKLPSACISPALKVRVKVNYSDGSLFVKYPDMSLDDGMNDVTFRDETRDKITRGGHYSTHYKNMLENNLIIKCEMTFLEENQESNNTTSNEIKSSKNVDVMRNLKSMYEPSILSDFIFKVGDKSFPAHKFILAAHSPVFKNMMTHEFLESKTNSVTITDATPEVFDLFLRSLYAGELESRSWDSLKELYYLVDKYDVGFLKTLCTDAIVSSLSVDLVCEILKLAYSYCDSDLKTAAINFAVNHIKEIVPREDWEELVKTHPTIGFEIAVNFIPK